MKSTNYEVPLHVILPSFVAPNILLSSLPANSLNLCSFLHVKTEFHTRTT